VLVYPYGIAVDQDGRRFFDEGSDLVHETWEAFARDIHFASKEYRLCDPRFQPVRYSRFERAIRSDVPPYQSQTLEGLAAQIGIPARSLQETVDAFNAAATGDAARFDATPLRWTGAVRTLTPPKSNWARVITKPPYLAYPLVGAIAYTFGGLATNEKAEVLSERGPISGLYAAGETTGIFTARRRMRYRCFERWFLDKLRARGCRVPAETVASIPLDKDNDHGLRR